MDILHRVIGLCDTLNERVGRLTAWGTLAMVAVTFAIVVLRYLFNLGWIAMQESVTYLHALIFMLGAAYTLKHDGHVRVDILYQKASARGRAWVDLLGTLLFLIPFCILGIYVTISPVLASWGRLPSGAWGTWELSSDPDGLPRAPIKSMIIVSFTLLLAQAISQAIKYAAVLTHTVSDHEASAIEEYHAPATE